MIAPQHIIGPMNGRSTPEALRQERDAWAAKQRLQGNTRASIAKALAISDDAATKAIRRGGYGIDSRPVTITSDTLRYRGTRFGSISTAFDAMPPEARVALVIRAEKERKPITQILAETFAASLRPTTA